MLVRDAHPGECDALTALAHASKAHWGYPSEWIALWHDELTFTPASFDDLRIHCAEIAGVLVAVCAIEAVGDEPELEHFWVHPSVIGRGVGRALLAEAGSQARARGATRLRILSDPNAEGFYLALGARRVGELPSKINARLLPCLELELGSYLDPALQPWSP